MSTTKSLTTGNPAIEFSLLIKPDLIEAPEGTFLFEGDLLGFYRALVSGQVLPLTLIVRCVDSMVTLVAMTLFMHRDVANHPKAASLVFAAHLAQESWGEAHISRDLSSLFHHIRSYLEQRHQDEKEQGNRIASVLTWLREYVLFDCLPQVSNVTPPMLSVLTEGSDGFVLAETPNVDHEGAWIELFRLGYFRGVLISPARNDYRKVTFARKSCGVPFDLEQATQALNAMETAMGEESAWRLESDRLTTPHTMILIQHLLYLSSRL